MLPSFLPELSDADRHLLEQQRITRFQHSSELIKQVVLHLNSDKILNIYCTEAAQVDELMGSETLEVDIQIILGLTHFRIWFEEEKIWDSLSEDLSFNSETLKFTSEAGAIEMATATLENPVETIVREAAQAEIEPIIDEAIEQELTNYFNSSDLQTLIRDRVQAKLKSRFSSSSNGTNGSGTATLEAPQTTTEPQQTESSQSSEFTIVPRDYSVTMYNALMAKSGGDRTAASKLLSQVKRQSKQGIEILDWIVNHFPEGKRDAAKTGLMKTSTFDRASARFKKETKPAPAAKTTKSKAKTEAKAEAA